MYTFSIRNTTKNVINRSEIRSDPRNRGAKNQTGLQKMFTVWVIGSSIAVYFYIPTPPVDHSHVSRDLNVNVLDIIDNDARVVCNGRREWRRSGWRS
jgi:hypothetical protein